MRAVFALSVACLLTVSGCGDGVGRPIVERDAAGPAAGAPAAGAPGGGGGASGWGGSGDRGDFPGFGGRGAAWGGVGGTGVPPGEHCARVVEWPDESESGERALFELLSVAREYGFPCMAGDAEVAVPPVAMKPELRCAARLHSLDMAERAFFDHVNPDGVGPEDRIRRAGYPPFRVAGESIALGQAPGGGFPYEVFDALFSAGGSECENLADPRFDSVGIGNYEDLWTLDFAGP